jgi:hypothetical protein
MWIGSWASSVPPLDVIGLILASAAALATEPDAPQQGERSSAGRDPFRSVDEQVNAKTEPTLMLR